MGIAITLENFLKTQNVDFQLQEHHYSEGSVDTARAANVPCDHLIKGVLFRDQDFHYTLVVVPASNRVLRHTLNQLFDRRLRLADEDELDNIFFDCEQGAIPGLGQAYGLNVVWDDQLQQYERLWLEAGDHEHLVQVSQREFHQLMSPYLHDHISIDKGRRH